mgnify:CR=1 FL=1
MPIQYLHVQVRADVRGPLLIVPSPTLPCAALLIRLGDTDLDGLATITDPASGAPAQLHALRLHLGTMQVPPLDTYVHPCMHPSIHTHIHTYILGTIQVLAPT